MSCFPCRSAAIGFAKGLSLAASLVALSGCGAGAGDEAGDEAAADPSVEQQTATRFELVIEDTCPSYELRSSGAFSVPVGMEQSGPVSPGSSFAMLVRAEPGDRLSFVSAFTQGNDLFLAPVPEGISLFDQSGVPRQGDVTGEIRLWDAGTEQNEAPGAGASQMPRQSQPGEGAPDGDARVRLAGGDGFTYPAVDAMLRVSLAPVKPGWVLVTLENVAAAGSLVRPDGQARNVMFSPGAWAVHPAGDHPLFTPGEPASPALEALAEEGAPAALTDALGPKTGERLGLSAGAWAVHRGGSPMLHAGNTQSPLAHLAASGDAAPLDEAVTNAPNVLASGLLAAAAGNRQTTVISARPGDRLSLVSRYGAASNLVLSTASAGASLFDAQNRPVAADLSGSLTLYLPVEGAADSLRPVDPEQAYPPLATSLRVSLRPLPSATP